MQALLFVIDTLFKLVACAFLLRLLMPLVRADLRSPIGQAVLKFTNPVVMPLRRLLGSAGQVDLASVVALFLVQLAATAVLRVVAGFDLAPGPLLAQALLGLAHLVLQFYFVVILVSVLLSWVAPGVHNPVAHLVGRLSEPLLRPFRRLIPPIAGLDFSAVFVLIGLQALQMLLR